MKKIFLRKSAIFQPLMRGTAKRHGFLHIGANLVAKRALGQMGQIQPISICIWENRPFFQNPLLGSARILKELISKILQKFEQASKSLS